MLARDLGLVAASIAVVLGAARARTPEAARARVLVGPEILVSRDGDFPHVELMIAANPKQPGNLVGTAITGAGRTEEETTGT